MHRIRWRARGSDSRRCGQRYAGQQGDDKDAVNRGASVALMTETLSAISTSTAMKSCWLASDKGNAHGFTTSYRDLCCLLWRRPWRRTRRYQQFASRAAPTRHVETGQLPTMDTTPSFDAGRAADRYLARVSGVARTRSDAYFEGGYWLEAAGPDLCAGRGGVSAVDADFLRIQEWAEERTHSRGGQVMLYAACYVPTVTLATADATKAFPRTCSMAYPTRISGNGWAILHRLCRIYRSADFPATALCRHPQDARAGGSGALAWQLPSIFWRS